MQRGSLSQRTDAGRDVTETLIIYSKLHFTKRGFFFLDIRVLKNGIKAKFLNTQKVILLYPSMVLKRQQ